MPTTPDRNPGQSIQDDGLLVEPGATSPTTNGEIRYVTGTGFQFREEGTTKTLGGGSGSPGGSSGQVQYNNSGAFAGMAKLTAEAEGLPVVGEKTTTNPASPGSGVTAFSRFRAGRKMLSQICADGLPYSFQPGLWGPKVWLWSSAGSATPALINFANNVTGTAVGVTGGLTLNTYLRLAGVRYSTATTAGSSAGTRHGTAQLGRGQAVTGNAPVNGFMYAARFALYNSNATTRFFVGLLNATAVIGNVNPSTLTNMVGFGCDAGQTTVRWFNNDGSGAASAVNLGAGFAVATGAVYEARIYCPPVGSTIYYSLERLDSEGGLGVVEGSVTTDIPANNTTLAPQVWINNGTTASLVSVLLSTQYVEVNYA